MFEFLLDYVSLFNFSVFVLVVLCIARTIVTDFIVSFNDAINYTKRAFHFCAGFLSFLFTFVVFNHVFNGYQEQRQQEQAIIQKVVDEIGAAKTIQKHNQELGKVECIGSCDDLFKKNGYTKEQVKQLAKSETKEYKIDRPTPKQQEKDISGLDAFMQGF